MDYLKIHQGAMAAADVAAIRELAAALPAPTIGQPATPDTLLGRHRGWPHDEADWGFDP
jgi:hypothetical protein